MRVEGSEAWHVYRYDALSTFEKVLRSIEASIRFLCVCSYLKSACYLQIQVDF